jgi:hypothetical protein
MNRSALPERIVIRSTLFLAAMAAFTGCKEVAIHEQQTQQTLCQDFFEACINPILTTEMFVPHRNTNITCAASGCHNVNTGSGGAFKLIRNARSGTLEITANFIAAKSFTNMTDPAISKLLLEPQAGTFSLVGSHGGGDIFADPSNQNYQEILFWISNPRGISAVSCPELDHFANDPDRRCLADGDN